MTHTGLDGKFWDFTSDLARGDTAYSNMALAAHTDSTYFVRSVTILILILSSLACFHTDRSLRRANFPPTRALRWHRWSFPPRRRFLRRIDPTRSLPRCVQPPLHSPDPLPRRRGTRDPLSCRSHTTRTRRRRKPACSAMEQ